MARNEKTSRPVATKASNTLRDSSASKAAKSLAGSALSQAGTNKSTSPKVATTAARALDDGRTSRTTKTLAGSVLTQKPRK